MRFSAGQRVVALCAKVDRYGFWEESEPCIDPKSFSWLPLTVIGSGQDSGCVEVSYSDGATTAYEERFLFLPEEAEALRLPKVTT